MEPYQSVRLMCRKDVKENCRTAHQTVKEQKNKNIYWCRQIEGRVGHEEMGSTQRVHLIHLFEEDRIEKKKKSLCSSTSLL